MMCECEKKSFGMGMLGRCSQSTDVEYLRGRKNTVNISGPQGQRCLHMTHISPCFWLPWTAKNICWCFHITFPQSPQQDKCEKVILVGLHNLFTHYHRQDHHIGLWGTYFYSSESASQDWVSDPCKVEEECNNQSLIAQCVKELQNVICTSRY